MYFLILCVVSSAFSKVASDEMPVFDSVSADDHSDMDLYDIISLSITKVDHDIDVYTKEDKQKWLDLHHIYRKNLTGALPQGSNLQFMEWNNTLEWAATEWLRYCTYKHARAEIDNMSKTQGQCMYRGGTRDIHKPMWMFYEEYKWYYFNNLTCVQPYPKYQCGHMKSVLWADTQHLGAARRSYCYPGQKLLLVNVHYLPSGNWVTPGFILYKYGWPCTRCPEGYFCTDKLCANARQCRDYNLDCSCKRVCQNCGKPDWKKCKCECKPGWDWEDCSKACSNEVEFLWKIVVCREYSRRMCDTSLEFRVGCRQFCLFCPSVEVTAQNANSGELCCGGKVCEPYYALNTNTCNCEMSCPSFICLFPPSTSTSTTSTTPATKNIAMTTLTPKVAKSKNLLITTETPKKNRPLQDAAAGISGSTILLLLLLTLYVIWIV